MLPTPYGHAAHPFSPHILSRRLCITLRVGITHPDMGSTIRSTTLPMDMAGTIYAEIASTRIALCTPSTLRITAMRIPIIRDMPYI
jgi:hypothetical protein